MRLYNQLIKETSNWIRFELGLVELKGSEYFKEMHYRAKSIFNFLFKDSDPIWLIASLSNNIDYSGIDLPNIKRFLRDKKLIKGLNCKITLYSLKVIKKDMRLDYIFKAIGNKDFARKPKVNGNFSFVNETKGIFYPICTMTVDVMFLA